MCLFGAEQVKKFVRKLQTAKPKLNEAKASLCRRELKLYNSNICNSFGDLKAVRHLKTKSSDDLHKL